MAGFTNNLSFRSKPQTQKEKRKEEKEQAKQEATKAKTSNKRPRTYTASPILDYGVTASPKKTGSTTNGNLSDRGYSNSRTPSFQPKAKSSGINQTSLGNPKGLRDLEKSNRNYYNYGSLHYPTPTKVQNSTKKPTQTSRISPEHQSTKPGIQSDIKSRPGGGITDTSAKSLATTKKNTRDIIANAVNEVQNPKKRWNKEDAMRERREAAKAAGKGNWNKEEVMKQRREAAKAAGKGNWNKEEVLRKRREEAMAKKKGGK